LQWQVQPHRDLTCDVHALTRTEHVANDDLIDVLSIHTNQCRFTSSEC